MATWPLKRIELVAAIKCPLKEAESVLREAFVSYVRGGDTPTSELEVLVLELYRFLTGLGLSTLDALYLCRQVSQSVPMERRLQSIRQSVETGDPHAKLHDALVIIYDGHLAKWFGGEKFFDLNTGQHVASLAEPPAYYVAWDAAVTLVRVLRKLGVKQDAEPPRPSARPADKP